MTEKPYTVSLTCDDLAPLRRVRGSVAVSSLRLGLYAPNGSGKTFISRALRLAANAGGRFPAESLISFGSDKCAFRLRLAEAGGETCGDIAITVRRGIEPVTTPTDLICHVFNQDYIDENVRPTGYEKSPDTLTGFIIGKANIDLDDDERQLQSLKDQGSQTRQRIVDSITAYLKANVDTVKNVTSLKDYGKLLSVTAIMSGTFDDDEAATESVEQCKESLQRLLSVPDDLTDIAPVGSITVDTSLLADIRETLAKSFTRSAFADDFKRLVRERETFVRDGLRLMDEGGDTNCPFCGQPIGDEACRLIDRYNQFLTDEETRTRQTLDGYLALTASIQEALSQAATDNRHKTAILRERVSHYLPTEADLPVADIDTAPAIARLSTLQELIRQKAEDITAIVNVDEAVEEELRLDVNRLNLVIGTNNMSFAALAGRLRNISKESLALRRTLCRAAYRHLRESLRADIEERGRLLADYKTLQESMRQRRETGRTGRRELTCDMIQRVLRAFFGDKYTMDSDTFRLTLNSRQLSPGEPRDVLSEGEKGIVALAYFLGDTLSRVESESDMERLFFVIDDPTSGLDQAHTTALSRVLGDLGTLFAGKLATTRILVLTHEGTFARSLLRRGVVTDCLTLAGEKLVAARDDFSPTGF